jgi:phosphoserine/homoserine phosphotransferase
MQALSCFASGLGRALDFRGIRHQAKTRQGSRSVAEYFSLYCGLDGNSAAITATDTGNSVQIVCLDLEGVLVPEIWIELSARTGIAALARTTRDEPDYDKLMRGRIEILAQHKLGLPDIQKAVGSMAPLPGAKEFLAELRTRFQIVILSDTFYEFAAPLIAQLDWPTLFCHRIEADAAGFVVDYHLRMPEQKRAAVAAFRSLNFKTIAAGDSYNDVGMLKEADAGFFFCPPDNVIADFPQFPVTRRYSELRDRIFGVAAKF